MNDLSDDARSLLVQAKAECQTDAAALARVRRNVLSAGVSIAVGAAGTAIAAKTAAAPAAPTAAWLLATKALGSLAVVGVVATGSVAVVQQLRPASPTAATATAATTPATHETAPRAVTTRRAEAQPDSREETVDLRAIEAQAPKAMPVIRTAMTVPRGEAVSAAAAPTAVVRAPPAERATEAEWTTDLALLRDAQSSLVAGDAGRARSLAGRVAAHGPFRVEREAILAIADCRVASRDAQVDAEGAQRRGAAFVNAHAGSPLAVRVSAACTKPGTSIP